MTIVCDVASARAPALTVNPRLAIAASMRPRVSWEIDRLPESAYDTVLLETPAARATSPIVAMVLRCFSYRFDKCVALTKPIGYQEATQVEPVRQFECSDELSGVTSAQLSESPNQTPEVFDVAPGASGGGNTAPGTGGVETAIRPAEGVERRRPAAGRGAQPAP